MYGTFSSYNLFIWVNKHIFTIVRFIEILIIFVDLGSICLYTAWFCRQDLD